MNRGGRDNGVMGEDRFVARISLWQSLALIGGSVAFVAIGIFFLNEPGGSPKQTIISVIAILFFGACGLLWARVALGRREQIIVDHHGVHWTRWSDRPIPWSEINAVSIEGMAAETFVSLYLKQPERFSGKGILGRSAAINQKMGYGDVVISTRGTDATPDDLIAAIERFAPDLPRR